MPLTPTDPTKPQIWITGEAPNQSLDFYIPQGPKGDPGGFTFGTLLSVDTNLNQILSSGIYRQPSTPNGTTNYPITAAGILTVMERLNDQTYYSVIQEYYPVNTVMGSGISYRRYYHSNSTWTPWRMFTSTRVDQTAGRAIYQWDDVNGREQLIWGDTGLRDITSLSTGGSGSLLVRRMGQQVTIHANGVQEASTVTGVRTLLSASNLNGMYPPSTVRTVAYCFDGTHYMCEILTSGEIRIYTTLTTISAHSFTLTYGTNSAWPTTLLGTAVTTPPNI